MSIPAIVTPMCSSTYISLLNDRNRTPALTRAYQVVETRTTTVTRPMCSYLRKQWIFPTEARSTKPWPFRKKARMTKEALRFARSLRYVLPCRQFTCLAYQCSQCLRYVVFIRFVESSLREGYIHRLPNRAQSTVMHFFLGNRLAPPISRMHPLSYGITRKRPAQRQRSSSGFRAYIR